MDTAEAKLVLSGELAKLRVRSYSDLAALVHGEPMRSEAPSKSGRNYQVECTEVWDGAKDGDVRVLGSIDDGGRRAYFPITMSFIKAPSGAFVGE